MRAPNALEWVMLGVVGFGLYAVYRLRRTTDEIPILRQQPVTPGPSPVLPEVLNVPNRIAMGRIDVGRNTPVRGRMETSDPARTAAALQQLGFQNVRLYTLADVQASPDVIPFPDALLNPTAGSRWFTATWVGAVGGAGPARASVQLPPEIALLWYTFGEPASRPAGPTVGFRPLIGPFYAG